MQLCQVLAGDTFTFMAKIDEGSATQVIEWLVSRRSERQLNILLTTAGGDTAAALAIHDTIRALAASGVKITVVVLGECLSAGVVVLMAAQPDCRFATQNARFMVHPTAHSCDRGYVPVDPYITDPALIDVIAQATCLRYKEAHELQEAYLRTLVAHSKLDDRRARELKAATTYFGVKTAVEYGFIASVLDDVPPAKEEPLTKWQRCGRRCRHPFKRFPKA